MLGFFEANLENLEGKGTYLLFIHLKKDSNIHKWHLKKGHYIYVGSAMAGLCQRIKRHFSKSKKKHWHIDYLLEKAKITKFMVKPGDYECETAEALSKKYKEIPSFGASDCRCKSHLFVTTFR